MDQTHAPADAALLAHGRERGPPSRHSNAAAHVRPKHTRVECTHRWLLWVRQAAKARVARSAGVSDAARRRHNRSHLVVGAARWAASHHLLPRDKQPKRHGLHYAPERSAAPPGTRARGGGGLARLGRAGAAQRHGHAQAVQRRGLRRRGQHPYSSARKAAELPDHWRRLVHGRRHAAAAHGRGGRGMRARGRDGGLAARRPGQKLRAHGQQADQQHLPADHHGPAPRVPLPPPARARARPARVLLLARRAARARQAPGPRRLRVRPHMGTRGQGRVLGGLVGEAMAGRDSTPDAHCSLRGRSDLPRVGDAARRDGSQPVPFHGGNAPWWAHGVHGWPLASGAHMD